LKLNGGKKKRVIRLVHGEMPEKALVKEDTFWSGRIRHAFELFQGERFVMR
jgi:hypothetical protein